MIHSIYEEIITIVIEPTKENFTGEADCHKLHMISNSMQYNIIRLDPELIAGFELQWQWRDLI